MYTQGRDLRFTQDSPVLPDAWAEYARSPGKPVDLLITPFQKPGSTAMSPARLAKELHDRLGQASARAPKFRREGDASPAIAANQTTVAVRLWLDELLRVVVPQRG